MATLTELKAKAAYKLALSTVGQALSAADNTQMTQAYNETYKELVTLGLATWASAGPIPDSVVDYVADIMAWKRADVYATPEIYQRCEQRYSIAERNIRRMVEPEYESADDPEDF